MTRPKVASIGRNEATKHQSRDDSFTDIGSKHSAGSQVDIGRDIGWASCQEYFFLQIR